MNTKIMLDRSDVITILYKDEKKIIQWKKQSIGNGLFEFIAIARFIIVLK
jgi:hypothetical protein